MGHGKRRPENKDLPLRDVRRTGQPHLARYEEEVSLIARIKRM